MIYLMHCSTSFEGNELIVPWEGAISDVKVIPLPCSGRIDILYLTKAFETGAHGVALVVCKKGECRYSEGNFRAKKRAEAVELLLEEIGFGRNRIIVIQLDDSGISKVVKQLADFRLMINELKHLPIPVNNQL